MPAPKGTFNAERAAMAAHVVAEAKRLHPEQIKFRFETCIQVERLAITTLRWRSSMSCLVSRDPVLCTKCLAAAVRGFTMPAAPRMNGGTCSSC